MMGDIDTSTTQDLLLSAMSFMAGVGVGAIAAIRWVRTHYQTRRHGD